MEEFTRVDIYDTKGIEYLFVIGYLLVLIIFWTVLKNPRRAVERIQNVIGTLSASVLRIPQGIFFSKQHTWAHLAESGEAKVGVDDFLQHVTGKMKVDRLRDPGETIRKGDLLTEIVQDGKRLKVFSPISGEILNANPVIQENPGALNENPYDTGWLYKIKPSDWVKETQSYMLAEKATEWAANEFTRLKEFLTLGPMRSHASEPSMVLLQDGGEVREHVLTDLPEEVWEDFQQEFLDFT
jgi:glycine cleavage system H protein